MGMGSTVPSLPEATKIEAGHPLLDWGGRSGLPGNSPGAKTVPETDTGGLVEDTQALERTVLKELGKMPP
jgi:hypothetical protein